MPSLPHSAADEAKAIVALAFRSGPLENIHAGDTCPACAGDPAIRHITQSEMKTLMKNAVNHVHHLLQMRDQDPERYQNAISVGLLTSFHWDDPEPPYSQRQIAKFLDRLR